MKHVLVNGVRLKLLVLFLGVLIQTLAAATLTVSPSTVGNTYGGAITVRATGLNSGEEVRIEKFLDANSNGLLEAGEPLVQSFPLIDGQANVIGGVTNINIPFDSEAAAGAITAPVRFQHSGLLASLSGRFIFKLSSPTARFAPATALFSVTNAAYSQSFNGTVKSSGTNVPNALVFLLTADASGDNSLVSTAIADNSGNYTITAPPGTYLVGSGRSNYVASFSGPVVNLPAGTVVTTNLNLVFAPARISGKVVDAANTSKGLPGLFLPVQSNDGFLASAFTDSNGNFDVPVTVGSWRVSVQNEDLNLLGYLRPSNDVRTDTTSGNVANLIVPVTKATALIYGSVKDDQNHPLADVRLSANDNSNRFDGSNPYSDADGYFVAAAADGNWHVNASDHQDYRPDLVNYVFTQPQTPNLTAGQAVLGNIIGKAAGHRITGHLVDGDANPMEGINIYAYEITTGYQAAGSTTDGTGFYSLSVANGSWQVGVSCYGDNGLSSRGLPCIGEQNISIFNADGVADFDAVPSGPLEITTGSTLPDATLNTAYSVQLLASGGTPSYTWSLLSNLPDGLSLNAGNGVISGTPAAVGVFNFTVRVTDSANNTANLECSITIAAGGGPDVAFYGISKQASFVQTSSGAPTLEAGSPFTFSASVNPASATSVSVASVKLPNGGSQALSQSSGSSQFGFKAGFPTQVALDAAYPSGAYLLSFNTQHDGNKSVNDSVPATVFPNAPHLSNYSAAQAIDPAADFTLNWDSFGGTAADFIKIDFSDQSGQSLYATPDLWLPGALDGTVTSFPIPANSLSSGKTYSVKIQFAKLATRDTVTYPGALGVVGFVAKTKFNISTTGASDTTPPALLSSSPANGAGGVALDSSVVFTFSEPMQSGYSINWSVPNTFSYSWSQDQRQLICNNSTLPPNTAIGWVLNPATAGQNFSDLAGNPLPSNVSGSFTTGADPNAAVGKWSYKPFMPTARVAPRAATLNGLLYVVGGFGSGNTYNTLEVYDPSRGTWKGLAPMPTPRASPAVGVLNGKLYVAGGFSGGTVLEVYDPASNTWTAKHPMSINHQGGTGGVIDNKFYVVGESSNFTKSLEVYDPLTDTWEDRTPMPNPRAAGAAVLNGLLYTVGGDSSGTVEVYDPSIDDWTQVASLPAGGNTIYNPGLAAMNGRLYVIGGYNNGTKVEVYDPALNHWSVGPSMLNARGDLAAAALPDKLFAVGGVGAPGQNPLPFMEQLALSDVDEVTTLILKSDASTLAAGLGSGVPSSAKLARLNAGDISGLTFQSALLGAEVVNSIYLPEGMPQNTQIIKIPPGDGQNGFFQLNFTLPTGYSGAQISCGATMDYYGRAFLNGNPLTPAIDSSQQLPAPGTIHGGIAQDTFFSTMNPAFFHAGANSLVFADINANGGPSAGAFYCFVTFGMAPAAPGLGNPVRISDNQIQFVVTGESGAKYRIETTASLANPSIWTNLGTNTATGGSFTFVDSAANGFNSRFYRAVRVQ